jgi:lysozyme
MSRPVPQILVKFLERVEGQKFVAYRDGAGVWSIGTGHTGPEVHEGLTWTQAQIDAALVADLALAVQRLTWAIGPSMIATLNDWQYAALLSFVFNEGEKADWTIWADIRQGALDDVPGELKKFIYIRDPVTKQLVPSKGLTNRRNFEIGLWTGTDPLCKQFPLH